MRAAGFEPEDYASDDVELWPENWPAWRLFLQVCTQWRVGVAGATGLDYGPLFRLMDRMDLGREEWDQLFDDIRVIESSALETMREGND